MMIKCRMTERSKEFPKMYRFIIFPPIEDRPCGGSLFIAMTYYIKQKTDDCLVYEPKDEEPEDRGNYVSDGRSLWELESTTRNDGNILGK